MKWLDDRAFRSTKLELRASPVTAGQEDLPKGICARATGIALTYNTPDDYGSVFVPGCLAKTRAEKVMQGKVKMFADHGPFTDTHVGVVRSLDDVGDSAVVTFDLFDTDAGRAMKQYLEAVLASGADTGLSVGFRPRDKEWRKVEGTSDTCLFYKEIELREISITPVPAVPGTDVTSVRREAGENDGDLLKRALRHILTALPERDARSVFDTVYASSAASPDTTTAAPPATPGASAATDAATSAEGATEPELATEADRVLAVRSSFAPR